MKGWCLVVNGRLLHHDGTASSCRNQSYGWNRMTSFPSERKEPTGTELLRWYPVSRQKEDGGTVRRKAPVLGLLKR
ncbi:hypothetical protein GOODEAATRI_015516 [Goodea atripinnis]|uniref:Uncharacterized protein n=1 Tax=Goodea atripinnis TaxID=208336 RepID=A0ABV0MSA0_9TELE